MIVAIEFLENSGVFYSEIGAQMHHTRAGGQKRLGKFGSESMGKARKTRPASRAICIGSGSENLSVVAVFWCEKRGKTWASDVADNCRDVAATRSTCGCVRSRRTHASPA